MLDYVLIAAAVCVAAYYSGFETGFYCINRLRLRLRAEQGERSAHALQRLVSRPQILISTALVGTNAGIYLATVLSTQKLRQMGLGMKAELWGGLILPPIFLIWADMIPKSLYQYHADYLMYKTLWPLRVSEIVLYPFSAFLRWISRLPQVLLRRRIAPRGGPVTSDAFLFYLSEGAARGALTSFQRAMAQNILRLKSVPVGATMTPLEKAIMISEEASREELEEVLRAHRYSRMPVWRGSRDRIVGAINVLDVASAERPQVRSLVRSVPALRPDTSVADALSLMRREKQQFAVVTDEGGRARGIVTAKDLVEEIVGELEAW
jgi:putative hemolysin